MDLFAALAEHEIPVVEEIAGGEGATVVGLADVVDVGASLLDGAPRLLLGLHQTGALEEVDQRDAVEELGPRDGGARRVLGHGQQHLLAEPGDLLPEERSRGLFALGHLGVAVHQPGDGTGQGPLGFPALGLLRRHAVQRGDVVVPEEGQEAQELAHLLVGSVEEELVHGEGTGAPRGRARPCRTPTCRTWSRRP